MPPKPPRYSRTTVNTPARPPSAAYPKGSPARRVIKTSSASPSILGFQRQAFSTSVNGVVTQQGSTVTSSGGPGGGGILGPLLIVGGVFMLWIVFRGRSGAMWDAITGNSGFSANLDQIANAVAPGGLGGGTSGSSKSGGSTSSANTADSGTHMGIDSSGNIITINSSYGNMTPEQKDAANAYAHQIGNVSG